MAKTPATPQSNAALIVSDDAARAAERLAAASEALAKAGESPILRNSSMFKDLAVGLAATGVALRTMTASSRGMVDASRQQARASQDAERALTRRMQAERRAASPAMNFQVRSKPAIGAAGMTDAQLGAQMTRRDMAMKAFNFDRAREHRVAGGLAARTLESQLGRRHAGARVEGGPRPQGNMGTAYGDARAANYAEVAGTTQQRYQSALDDVAKRRMLHDYDSFQFRDGDRRDTLPSARSAWDEQQRSGWVAMAERNKTRAAEAAEQMKLELGGAAYADNSGPLGTAAAERRERQGEAYATAATADMTEQVRDSQRLLELETRRSDVMRSSDGTALLQREGELRAAITREMREQLLIQSRLETDRMASAEGALGLRDQAAQEAQQRREKAAQSILARQGELAYMRSEEGQAGGLVDQGQAQTHVLQDLSKSVELHKDRLKYVRSPEGARAQREQVRLEKERQRVLAQTRKTETYNRHGGGVLGGLAVGMDGFREKMDAAAEGLKGIADWGQKAAAGASAAILGLGSIADPFTSLPTLTASARDLGIELGRSLAPVLMDVSGLLQRSAQWVASLSDGFKANVAKMLVWVAGAGSFVAAMYKGVMAARALTVALGGVKAALGVGVLTLAAGAVFGLATQYAVLGENAWEASRAVGSLAANALGLDRLQARKADNVITAADLQPLPDAIKAKLKATDDPAQIGKILREFKADAQKQLDALKVGGIKTGLGGQDVDRKIQAAMKAAGVGEARDWHQMFSKHRWQSADARERADIPFGGGWSLGSIARGVGAFFGGKPGREPGEMRAEARLADQRDSLRLAETYLPRVEAQLKAAGNGSLITPQLRSRLQEAFDLQRGVPSKDRWEKMTDEQRAQFRAPPQFGGGFEERRRSALANVPLRKLEDQIKAADTLIKKSAATDPMRTATRFPVSASITDPSAFSNRLQIDALNGSDYEKELTQKQIDIGLKMLEKADAAAKKDDARNARLDEIHKALGGGPAAAPPHVRVGR